MHIVAMLCHIKPCIYSRMKKQWFRFRRRIVMFKFPDLLKKITLLEVTKKKVCIYWANYSEIREITIVITGHSLHNNTHIATSAVGIKCKQSKIPLMGITWLKRPVKIKLNWRILYLKAGGVLISPNMLF